MEFIYRHEEFNMTEHDRHRALARCIIQPAERIPVQDIFDGTAALRQLSKARHYVFIRSRQAKHRALGLIAGCAAFLAVAVALAVSSL